MDITGFFKKLLSTFIDGSFERIKMINIMNSSFKECFYCGELARLCKVSISQGDEDFAHEMSSFRFRSGFKISIENDLALRDSEITEISTYILENKAFVRRLMAMGFDTLIVQGNTTKIGRKYSLKAYSNLNNYFIQ